MSNFETFALVTEGNTSTAPSRFIASTADSLVTITAAGYLNDLAEAGLLKANDIIDINYADTTPAFPLNVNLTAVLGSFVVGYSAPDWSLASLSTVEFQVAVPLSAAQFNGMYATPVQLIAAPGANLLVVVDSVQLVMTYGTAAFAAGGVVAAQYDLTANGAGVKATNTEVAADFFAAASTSFSFQQAQGALPFATTVNKGIYLSNATGAFTTGDSTFVANVAYHVVSVA